MTASRITSPLILAGLLCACGSSGPAAGPSGATRPAADRPDAVAPVVLPGAPGQAGRTVTTEAPSAPPARNYTQADVDFMQGMIAHHAQALVMTEMTPTRAVSDRFMSLSERITVSQVSEIAMMQNWLRTRGEAVPSTDATHHHHMGDGVSMMMPGMLTEDQLAEMRSATGLEFERLFLTYMIGHHEGALVMVAELFAQDGAAQETDVFQFASDVDSDQRMEIRRMREMLASMANRP